MQTRLSPCWRRSRQASSWRGRFPYPPRSWRTVSGAIRSAPTPRSNRGPSWPTFCLHFSRLLPPRHLRRRRTGPSSLPATVALPGWYLSRQPPWTRPASWRVRSSRKRTWSSSGQACERWHVSSTVTEAVLSPSHPPGQSAGRALALSRSGFRKPPPGPASDRRRHCLTHRNALFRPWTMLDVPIFVEGGPAAGPGAPGCLWMLITSPRSRPRPQRLAEHRLCRHAPECPAMRAVVVDPARVVADPAMRHAQQESSKPPANRRAGRMSCLVYRQSRSGQSHHTRPRLLAVDATSSLFAQPQRMGRAFR